MQLVLGEGRVALFSRTGDDIAEAFPDVVDNVFGEAVLDGELLVGARVRRRRRSTTCSSGSTARSRRGKLIERVPGLHPRLRHAVRRRARISARCRWTERRARLEAWFGRNPQTRMDLSRGAPVRRLGGAGRNPPARRRRARPRGRDGQAPDLALCAGPAQGAVVQVEARPQRRRRHPDVCAARPRQALELLLRLSRSGCGRATRSCRSARPISASPTRS